ncbi:hypothetical protein [Enteractinococcus coprophilus]|uniref:Uncharacterized protein n=1 Tax=Enteractinococcus coprophilus TaxID=1027633 RepID=A0A543AJ57_9MICC|nr:hypothetical protein [Enteractinococcus coprophilus]TQL72609.1 hypothetical protein FB556_1275 [Enteractinococcus coprophilus]
MGATIHVAGPVLADSSLAVLPGVVLIAAYSWLARTDTDPLLRIVMLLLGFVLIRNAMTPAGLWDVDVVDGVVPWIRMTDNPVILVVLGGGSLILVAATLRDTTLRALVWWSRPNISTQLLGLGGALVVVSGLFLYGRRVFFFTAGEPVETRGWCSRFGKA